MDVKYFDSPSLKEKKIFCFIYMWYVKSYRIQYIQIDFLMAISAYSFMFRSSVGRCKKIKMVAVMYIL